MNFLIALDQMINTLVFLKVEYKDGENGFGYSDETLSARVWRVQHPSYKVIDKLFFFDKEGDKGHCQLSFEAEMQRKHLPKRYWEFLE